MRSPLDFIEKLQQKPEAERRTIAALVVIVLMAIIVGVWITTFSIAPSEPLISATTEPSPFSLLWNFVKDSVNQFHK